MSISTNGRPAERDLAMRWFYANRDSMEGEACAKDVFLSDRNLWEQLQKFLHNEGCDMRSHDECKDLIRSLDKAGLLTHESIEAAHATKDQKRNNVKEWGTPEGTTGFRKRVDRIRTASSDITDSYLEYLSSSAWRQRSLRYLNQRCSSADNCKWVCEMCGTLHEKRAGRTIQVHHNDYSILGGAEPDEHLMACCEELCHGLADIARRIKTGKLDAAEINDALRPLFQP